MNVCIILDVQFFLNSKATLCHCYYKEKIKPHFYYICIPTGECTEKNETINRSTAIPEDVTSPDGIIKESNANLFEPLEGNKDWIR